MISPIDFSPRCISVINYFLLDNKENLNLEVLNQFVTDPILSDLMFEEHRRCQRACGRKYISSEACIFYERNSLST